MSYILEALKKAEAERRSGNAPSIHSPHTFAPARATRPWWRHPAARIAAAIVLLAVVIAAWLLTRQQPAQTATVPAPPAPAPATAASPPTPPPAPAPPASAAPPPAATAAPPSVEPRAARPEPKPRPVTRKTEEKPAPAPKAKAKPEESAQPLPPPLRELPEQVQREIPPLDVGGYIYSPVPADRSVLINKKLLREGDEVAPGLTLERMTPSGMVLNYRGHRYRSSY